MKKNDNHSFSSVISVNPYNNSSLSGISSFLNNETSPEFKKDQYAISFLNTKSFINAKIDISKNIPEEDLYDAINNKVYDELALDQALTYQIKYIETFDNLDEDNRHFHVFVVDPSTLKETFSTFVDKIKYIDIIIPVPLLIKSLYSKDIIQDGGMHCFIYFQENDAFVTLYNEKEFIYTKSINHSYIQMHERFCELYGEQIEYNEFIDFLRNENLKTTTSEYKECIIKLYKEIFANINDILTYVKRAFEIVNIQKVYIGNQISTITKLDEMAEVELNVRATNFEFDYGFQNNTTNIDQLHALMHIYTSLDDIDKYDCNFTAYFRPEKFIKRDSGKLILLSVASFILAFIYPISYWILTYAQELQYNSLKQEYSQIHNTKITREAIIKNRLADKEKIVALLTQNEKDYNDKKNTLIKIHDVKVNYPMKAKLLSILIKDLNIFNVNLKSISYSENNNEKSFVLNLISNQDEKITKLVKYLTKIHEKKFNFSLETISYKKKDKKYYSELKVKIL